MIDDFVFLLYNAEDRNSIYSDAIRFMIFQVMIVVLDWLYE
ncbi:hypothetical protein ECHLIB_0329 [Ehrlichia chaffeensis str. Liberty]|uniref:Uncharacterized protein n=1 Tax=Ehrlichia chaffeensis (strain ATCC CRL-10679 / Arkansas) TaxID=205920 RepID=Q2GG26_EHRCR|nr:hypothetical protein ECH_0810 [Ehrlichia chaffeensis str. Arkansas]AHX06395.1 hypothetical protein ECHLIB_0329 [Ehrlichia chaffeensis str. Liberty]AHX08167.1 hypothetical protein ECHSTV_0322 [Ehrlichia chaffeensis str. Saint Vincent]